MDLDADIVLNLRVSCTEEEAVAKMIGWLRGPVTKRFVRVTEYGIPSEDMPFMTSLDAPLEEYLYEAHSQAKSALLNAIGDERPEQEIDRCEEQVAKVRDLIITAHKYWAALRDELQKGPASVIALDTEASSRTGEPHYTLASVDRWARGALGISVLGPSVDKESVPQPAVPPKDEASNARGGLTKTKADNLLVTFALLVRALATIGPKYGQEGKPNVSQIASCVAKLASKLGDPDGIKGQGTEAIKDRIELAERALTEALPRAPSKG